MHRKNYSISTYNLLTIINENTVKYYYFVLMYYTFLKSLYCFNYKLRDLSVDTSCMNTVIEY